jgi:homocysteine S-methyltransferase
MNAHGLNELIRQFSPIILDGAMATEIEKQGFVIDSALWSAAVIHDHPDSVKKVHMDYFEAGADVATTNTYQATLPGFQQNGYSKQEAEQSIIAAVQIAIQARSEFWKSLTPVQQKSRPFPLIAGSVGPYGAYLADGSEYTGNYALGEDDYRMFHRSRMHLLKDAGADLFAFETMPNFSETGVLANLLHDEFPDDAAWLSFSLSDDHHLCDGTPLADAVSHFNAYDQIAAIGVNCVPTSRVSPAIHVIRQVTDKPMVVYPNSGERYDPITKTWTSKGALQSYEAASAEWAKAGASLIGGCCRTSPDDIRQIAKWARD